MASACGCAYEPAAWAAQVENACRKLGAQLTPLRRQVRDILSASGSPLGAYAILEEMSRREGKHIAPPTVYRTLDFFLQHGFVHKIESLNAYTPCEHLKHAHHGMLLICESCGRSQEVEDVGVVSAIAATAMSAGFAPRRLMTEAQGLCRDCADRRTER